ncbi:Rha family transcriptional regulator [Burkholderia orbicola]|uniref:Rha family transcriptional regulator n=1 Tax=Burkholderia orbicola TaxID=2978683 RepID=UPI002651574E|nr:phage antirepressor KilAC domain-containing protein [Burkholderia orbicola]MDN7560802.1 Rha family transcriptional regulator [Burkholderia orbicola]
MNNGLINFDPAQTVVTMNSLQIAELVNIRHDNVKRTIESLADRSVISLPQIEEVKVQRERRAESVSVYVFAGEQGERDTTILVAQLSPEFTARLVDTWREMKAALVKASNPFLTASRRELLQVALEAEERAEKAQALADKRKEYIAIYKEYEISYQEEITAKDAVIKLATPAIKFQQTYEQTGEPLGFRAVAKNLRANEREFSSFLKDKGIMYKSKNKYVPYAGYVNTPYFCSKVNYVGNLEWEFTASGFIWVSQWWAKYQAEKRISTMPKGGLFNRGAQ